MATTTELALIEEQNHTDSKYPFTKEKISTIIADFEHTILQLYIELRENNQSLLDILKKNNFPLKTIKKNYTNIIYVYEESVYVINEHLYIIKSYNTIISEYDFKKLFDDEVNTFMSTPDYITINGHKSEIKKIKSNIKEISDIQSNDNLNKINEKIVQVTNNITTVYEVRINDLNNMIKNIYNSFDGSGKYHILTIIGFDNLTYSKELYEKYIYYMEEFNCKINPFIIKNNKIIKNIFDIKSIIHTTKNID